MDNIGIGLQLMIVGMATVFLILLIVIYGGKLLIKAVNRFAPEETEAPKKVMTNQTAAIDANTMSVLQAVVAKLTDGKGHVASAKKI
ncbi:MAG: OadG family protein [Bacteroidaceae bacterium]|nr:OadG family protein [Bacteroidaceae bacterium]